jgi:hypothetical protein
LPDDDDDDEENIDKLRYRKPFVWYENNYCNKSFFIFSQENYFRRLCYRAVKYENFESIILVAIIFSSLKLVVDTYLDSSDPS